MMLPLNLIRIRFRVGIAVVGAMICAVATAGVGVWTTNGPTGGAYGVITDPNVPGIVYTGGGSGIARSVDNGATWVATALSGSGYFALATGSPTTVYATGPYTGNNGFQVAVFYSRDEGDHWNTLSIGDFGTSYLLAVDPVTPTILYLVTNFYHGGDFAIGGLERSNDGGLTWTGIGVGLAEIGNIAVAPSQPSTLYAKTAPFPASDNGGLVGLTRSLDSGATWSLRSTSLQEVSALVVDPANSSVVYALTSAPGVLKSVDGGSTFVPANTGLTSPEAVSLCIDPLRSNRVYVATTNGVFWSADAGATWQPMNNGLPSSALTSMTGIAIDATGAFLHAATASGIFDYEITGLPCAANSHTLCLNNGRFSVTATFQTTPEGPSTPATAVPLTADTGYFWFFDPANIELVVKVLTGCPVNNDYWVFAGGLTDVGVELVVTDTVTGAVKMYSNPVGTPFQPIQDSSAFPCP